MENSVENSDIFENSKKSKSLDVRTLYDEKSRVSVGEGNDGSIQDSRVSKRKRRSTLKNDWGGLGQVRKRRKRRKEVSLSSFEPVIKKSRKGLNAVVGGGGLNSGDLDSNKLGLKLNGSISHQKNLTKTDDGLVAVDGSSSLNNISQSLDDKVIAIPKRPRGFLGRRKLESNHVAKQAVGSASKRVTSLSTPSSKLTSDPITPIQSSVGKLKKILNAVKGNNSNRANSLSVIKGEEAKRVNRNRRKRQRSRIEKQIRAAIEPLVEHSADKCEDVQEDDEENLEQNAARMLSSRFDPSCTGFSGNNAESANGSSFSPWIDRQLKSSGANASEGPDTVSVGTFGRVLRPRSQYKHERFVRKRRHFYEICSRDLDVNWVVNKRIKVLWPLDNTWYFGLVKEYDPVTKMHHVKYDDRDEEWINLQNERFKLLLLPGEVPGKFVTKKSGLEGNRKDEDGDANVLDDNCTSSFMDSEPLISWLAQTARQVKSSPFGTVKKPKRPRASENISPPTSSENSAGTRKGFLSVDSSRTDMNKLSVSSVVLKRSVDGEITEKSTMRNKTCSSGRKIPYVYFRRRFHKRAQGSGNIIVENSALRSVTGSVSFLASIVDRLGALEEFDISLQSSTMEDSRCLNRDRTLLFEERVALSKLSVSPIKFGQVKLNSSLPRLRLLDLAFGPDWFWLYHTLLCQRGGLMIVWPNVHLEILVVDNVVGLKFLLFEGCLKEAVAFVCLILAAFPQPNGYDKILDLQLPVTSIRFKLSSLPDLGRQLVFVFYSFLELRSSKWLHLDGEFKHHCSVTKELPLTECTYANIKVLRSGGDQIPVTSFYEETVSLEASQKRSRQGIRHWECSSSSFDESLRRPSPFVLPFAATPFFLRLHLKRLMENNVASISSHDSMSLPEGGDCSPVEDSSDQSSEITLDNIGSSCIHSKVETDALSVSNDGDLIKSSQKSLNCEVNVAGTSVGCQDPGKNERDASFVQQSATDLAWNMTDYTIRGTNPTAPRSIGHRNRHHTVSSFGHRTKLWPDGREDFIHNGFVNGSRKPRTQVSYLLPFGDYEFGSKPRSHHRKGRPYKRVRNDNAKRTTDGSKSPQKYPESLSCDANVLVTIGDKGWRECGAHVVLESFDQKDWRLLVKFSGAARYSHEAHQFLQPGTTNRHTHAMMWKGGKDWILEFSDRSQWTLFKEMYEECYKRNIRAASVKNIPIPGVRLVEDSDDNAIEVPFVRSSPKYFRQFVTEVDMALDPSRILYDMDSDDEDWILKFRNSSDVNGSEVKEISEEMFERVMDMFEKVSYAEQRDEFTCDEIEDFMDGVGPMDVIKAIHEHWRQKRQRKGMPLIRQFQPPLWEWYQQQVKEWELKMHHFSFSNGCKEKAVPVERPPMFAFCLRPRGLEVSTNKGTKQRSQRRFPATGYNGSFYRDQDGLYTPGRKVNGIVSGEETFFSVHNHEPSDISPRLQPSMAFSPRDAKTGFLSIRSHGSDRNQYLKLQRQKSKKMRMLMSPNSSQMAGMGYNQTTTGNRNGVSRWNMGVPEWPTSKQYQPDGFQRQRAHQLGGEDLEEFRLRDASSAAQHASNMAKLKREKAQRLLRRADLALHKATVALMTAEAIKESEKDLIGDG
ncbi:enhancer of polycomb-like transcription factor protein [Tasmannia lanceolata]|uniref:enhancer of polycomb-like transcription factor protein n=1 Tax=Tasmannia lanceolata TaxID=3420 RepID=UPI004063587E